MIAIMKRCKIISMYLPQYHVIPENSRFWGEGFTDWDCVKSAKPLFPGHNEPRIPQGGYYYDLSKKEDIKKQINLAHQYHIYGFGIYHYWFSTDKRVLTKPAELILENKDLDIPFFFAWDNASWKKSWSNVAGNDWAPMREVQSQVSDEDTNNGILIPFVLGTEKDWKVHFDYLLDYFRDDRYIKVDNKPIFIVWNYSKAMEQMVCFWNKLAKENGFSGMEIIYKYSSKISIPEESNIFYYEPAHCAWDRLENRIKNKIKNFARLNSTIKQYDYDTAWNHLLKDAARADRRTYLGAFVDYDDSPRRANRGQRLDGASPEKFENYLAELLNIAKEKGKEYIFLTAWNEWGEGAYLEPDETNHYAYLEAINKAITRQ